MPFDLEASMTRFTEIQHYPIDQDAFDDMSVHARKIVEE